jgi:adenylosuccinate lyase
VIDRYQSAAMAAVFVDAHRYRLWRQVELAVIDAYVHVGIVASGAADAVRAAPIPTAEAIAARESLVRHEVVAFLSVWTASMPSHASSVVHRGLTSSDVVDTALALQLGESSQLIDAQLERLINALKAHALAHRHTPRVGRTHGQHATREVWGHRVADFAFAAHRARERFAVAADDVRVAKLSGPTGAYLHVPREVEIDAAARLGLRPVEVATQVVLRDRLAAWVCALAGTAAISEAVALEVRLGQHSAVGELAETAASGQAGSSAMPHKRNPITAEKICGLARLVRGYVVPVMDGIALWHERDLSHSSVERVCIPDAAALTEHVLEATASLVENLTVDAARMAATLAASPASAQAHTALTALADAGIGWEGAWQIVQAAIREMDVGSGVSHRLRAAATARQIDLPDSVLSACEQPATVNLDHLWDAVARL